MKKLIGVIACIMLLGLSSVFAQSKQVTGTITCQVSQGCLEFLNFNYAAMLNIYF
jgi:hypothetical protein